MGAVVADSCCPDVGLLVVVGGLGSADHLREQQNIAYWSAVTW